MASADVDRRPPQDEPGIQRTNSINRQRPREDSIGRRTGEVVQILGSDEDFFGANWNRTVTEEKTAEEGDSTEQEDEEVEDFSGHSVHTEGVPSCETKLKAKDYKTPAFAETLLHLLRDELAVEGWEDLPPTVPASALSIHKVSGSLTNAVFFISCPSPPPDNAIQIWDPAPTVLLRIYGPSSGSLISRQHELHLIHTLSATYGIGPLVLGTFFNGRVEEYFESRALHKEELRDPRISRWIARRMRELHSVDLKRMFAFEDGKSKPRSTTPAERSQSAERRPSLQSIHWGNGSTSSLLSTSSQSSSFSWSSAYSSGSDASSSFGTGKPVQASPASLTPTQPSDSGASESSAIRKKRSRSRLRSSSVSFGGKQRQEVKSGAWENIKRWDREAAKVLVDMDALGDLNTPSPQPEGPSTPRSPQDVDLSQIDAASFSPLASPSSVLRWRQMLDMPRLRREIKAYRAWLKGKEKKGGKSKRVFAHNDTQYGNLLLRNADDAVLSERPHEQIMVIDFEYASANPRGFDLANHFHEWQADYHHDSLSFSLSSHGSYPTLSERRRFYRAYVGADLGYDGHAEHDPRTPLLSPFVGATLTEAEISHLSLDDQRELEDERGVGTTGSSRQNSLPPPQGREDPRVIRLEEEVRLWSPCSHAMWGIWGIVQAHEDVKARIEQWKEQERRGQIVVPRTPDGNADGEHETPKLHRTRSGEVLNEQGDLVLDDTPATHEVEFDYLAYSLGRITLFRHELEQLGIAVA